MAKRFVAELPRNRIVWRGLGIVDPLLAEGFLTDAVSYLSRSCVQHHGRCIGISLTMFFIRYFSHLGSPKVSLLDGWNEGHGKRGTPTLFEEMPRQLVMASRWTVLATKLY
jgi:hypothetical protein